MLAGRTTGEHEASSISSNAAAQPVEIQCVQCLEHRQIRHLVPNAAVAVAVEQEPIVAFRAREDVLSMIIMYRHLCQQVRGIPATAACQVVDPGRKRSIGPGPLLHDQRKCCSVIVKRSRPSDENVVAGVADNAIRTGAADQQIATCVSRQEVVPGTAK